MGIWDVVVPFFYFFYFFIFIFFRKHCVVGARLRRGV